MWESIGELKIGVEILGIKIMEHRNENGTTTNK